MRFAEPYPFLFVLLTVVVLPISFIHTKKRVVASYIFNYQQQHSLPHLYIKSEQSSQQHRQQLRSYIFPITTKEGTNLFGSIENNRNNDSFEDDTDGVVSDGSDQDNFEEETLLRISMMILPQNVSSHSPEDDEDVDNMARRFQQQQDKAIEKVSKFCETFPFAAILPVQPLQYFPIYLDGKDFYNVTTNPTMSNTTSSSDDRSSRIRRRRCVEVQFLRKKTPERGSIDGGIRFYIQPQLQSNYEDSHDEDDVNSTDNNKNNSDSHVSRPQPMMELIAKRNSQGQVITKIFAEKLIITNFVASFLGSTTPMMNTDTNTNTTSVAIPSTASKSLLKLQLRYPSPISENIVQLQSIYHKWM